MSSVRCVPGCSRQNMVYGAATLMTISFVVQAALARFGLIDARFLIPTGIMTAGLQLAAFAQCAKKSVANNAGEAQGAEVLPRANEQAAPARANEGMEEDLLEPMALWVEQPIAEEPQQEPRERLYPFHLQAGKEELQREMANISVEDVGVNMLRLDEALKNKIHDAIEQLDAICYDALRRAYNHGLEERDFAEFEQFITEVERTYDAKLNTWVADEQATLQEKNARLAEQYPITIEDFTTFADDKDYQLLKLKCAYVQVHFLRILKDGLENSQFSEITEPLNKLCKLLEAQPVHANTMELHQLYDRLFTNAHALHEYYQNNDARKYQEVNDAIQRFAKALGREERSIHKLELDAQPEGLIKNEDLNANYLSQKEEVEEKKE